MSRPIEVTPDLGDTDAERELAALAPRPPRTAINLEFRRRRTLDGWVVGWGDLFLDDDGFLDLRPGARVFPSWPRAFLASWFGVFGWPRRNRPAGAPLDEAAERRLYDRDGCDP